MPTFANNSAKGAILAVLIIAGVVVFLFVFHFLLGMTWMIYVLVLSVIIIILVRKMVVLKRQRARTAKGGS